MEASTQTATAPVTAPAAQEYVRKVSLGLLGTIRRHGVPTLKYLCKTEVHTYAFSVAANAILSFFPFVVLMLTLTRRLFHSQAMYDVVLNLLNEYLPSNRDFVIRNLRALASGHRVQVFSMIMLVISSTGIFLPLEVALNKVWGFTKDRSYIGNQVISLGLAFACGALALCSVAGTAANMHYMNHFLGENFVTRTVTYIVMKVFAMLASIGIFVLIYWLLPNGKVPLRAVMPAAVITGLLFELAKQIYVLSLPLLDFAEVYGPFSVSVTLIFWAFVSGLLLLGGAFLSAAEHSSPA